MAAAASRDGTCPRGQTTISPLHWRSAGHREVQRTPFPAQARSPNETEVPSKRRTVQAGTGRTSQAIEPARPERARLARPSEPSLFPKLRLQFADFPYLHLPMDQRLLTLET